MSRIRVLQIVAGLDVGHAFGGAERCGLALAHHFDRNMVDPFVCGFWQTGSKDEAQQIDVLQNAGIAFFFATKREERRASKDFFAGARRIVEWCNIHHMDVVHAQHEGGALAALMARWSGGARRAVRTAHVPLTLEWGAGGVGMVNRALFSRLLFPLWMDAEISVSLEHADRLRRRWLARLLHREPEMIYQAMPRDLPTIDPAARHLDCNIIIAVGRLVAQKNHGALISAMPHVLEAVPDVKLWIVGDGELRDALQQQIVEARLESAVTLWGARADVPALLAQAAVFALPSVWEGIPLSLIESISAGVPVVASDLPGVRELITPGQSGWLVPAGQPTALAEALIEALSNVGKRTSFAQKAQAVLPVFAMPAIVARHMSLYQRILQA